MKHVHIIYLEPNEMVMGCIILLYIHKFLNNAHVLVQINMAANAMMLPGMML